MSKASTVMMMKVTELVDASSSRTVDVAKPTVAKHPTSVLVKVAYTAVDTFLEELAHKTWSASVAHDLKAKPLIPCTHFSGWVEAVGEQVDDFQVGDAVLGHLQYESTVSQGAASEYVLVPATDLAKFTPSSQTSDDTKEDSANSMQLAAASTVEGMTALQALRDYGQLKAGDAVLVVGASGGVGSMAVGMARQLQAGHVSAVCSTKDVEKVKALGAHQVIDRNQAKSLNDWQAQQISSEQEGQTSKLYNVIVDTSGKYGFWSVKHLLAPGGRLVSTLPHMDTMVFGGWLYPLLFAGKSSHFVLCQSKRADLELLGSWTRTNGKKPAAVQVSIDSVHPVRDFDQAWNHFVHHKSKGGRVLVQVAKGW